MIVAAILLAAAVPATDRLSLDWPPGHVATIERTDDEIVLRFDMLPDAAAIAAFGRAAGADLAALDYNDTSMVIRAATGRRFVAQMAGTRLTIAVVRDAPPAAPAAGERAVALARVAADAAAGYPGRARRRALALHTLSPDDAQVARTLADLDAARGAVVPAAARYRAIQADDAVARRTIRAAGGEVSATTMLRDGGGFSQAELAARLTMPLAADWTAGGGVRTVRTRSTVVVGRDGAVGALRRNDALADVTATMLHDDLRVEVTGAANLLGGAPGAAVRLALGAAEREWRVSAAWRLPDVTTAEQALLGGTIDRIGAGATLRLTAGLAVQGDVARTGYRLSHEARRATTTAVTAGAEAVLRRRAPMLSLFYRLEAEYVAHVARRADGALALPLVDRENHTAQLLVAEQLGAWRLGAAGGWTIDRFGGGGPTAALTLARYLGDAVQIEGAGGVSSIRRPGVTGTQLFARVALRYALGRGS